tara:strand:+ start:39601 stop:39783 length:183 start_codon:yes stop_codon:yes gene_type:complete
MYKIEIFFPTDGKRISVHYYETKKLYLSWLIKRREQHPNYFVKGSEMIGTWKEINLLKKM